MDRLSLFGQVIQAVWLTNLAPLKSTMISNDKARKIILSLLPFKRTHSNTHIHKKRLNNYTHTHTR